MASRSTSASSGRSRRRRRPTRSSRATASSFGASLNPWTTARGSYLEGKRVVHCEIERGCRGHFSAFDAAVIGDTAAVADTIVQWLDDADVAPTDFRSDDLARALAEYSPGGSEDRSTDTTVDIRTALLAIDRAVPDDRVLVTDGGRFIFETMLMMRAPDPSSFVWTVNIGSIGLRMGTAIGAGVAALGRPVLLITGDGGFMMGGLTEFNSAVRHNIDLVVVVFNDDAYGAEHIQFRNRDMDPSISMFGWPDLAPVAESLGGQGVTVRNVKDLDALDEVIANRNRPLLIDVKLDPDHVPMGGH